MSCEGKDSWPELVGTQGRVAEATIEWENPLVNSMVVLEGSFGTTDHWCDKVRVFVNPDGIVTSVPVIG